MGMRRKYASKIHLAECSKQVWVLQHGEECRKLKILKRNSYIGS